MSLRGLLYGLTAVFLLGGAAAGVDVYTTYRALERLPEKPAPVRRSRPPRARPKAPKRDYSAITRRGLFGLPPPPKPKRPLRPPAIQRPVRPPVRRRGAAARKKKPRPKVNLRLVGTTVGPVGGESAILEEPGTRKQHVVRLGEKIRGATLVSVERGRVRLRIRGTESVLRAFQAKKRTARLKSPLVTRPGARRTPPFSRPRAGSAAGAVRRSDLRKLMSSPEQLRNEVRGIPFRSPRGDRGVRLFPRRPRGVIRQMGLRRGDVVVRLDSTPVTDLEELGAALAGLRGRSEAEAEILRGGKKRTIRFLIR